jgi:alkylation response protein AidB-like acyl-CoA dehydrogenase
VSTTTSEGAALVSLVGDFAREQIAPRVADYDAREELPQDLVREMGRLGFLGGVIPIELGGLGLDYRTFVAVVEEISKVCQSLGTIVTMPSGLVGASIHKYGTESQIDQWLRPLAEGVIFGGAGVTEPDSGSDVAAMRTTYRMDGDRFVITGAKAWISNLDIADFFVTFATRDRSLRHRGVTAFIVPRDTPGLTLRPYHNKLGFRPLASGDLILDEVCLPPEAVLGEVDGGFPVAMTAVERGRLGVAARAVGLAQACLDDTVSYAKARTTHRGTIADFQLVQSKITDMVVGTQTARLLVRECADAIEGGLRARQLASMAKMYATDVAYRSAGDAVLVHGANGVSPEYRVGRFYRDAKVLQIVEGSNDLHRAMIGEMALGIRTLI